MSGRTDICVAGAPRPKGGAGDLRARAIVLCLVGLLALAMLVGCSAAGAQPRRAAVVGSVSDGFARLILTFPEEIDADVRQSSGILIIGFKEPLDIDVEQLSGNLPDYVSVARRDPDGTAIRLALTRKVTINTMAAGERLYVDLLPEDWSGRPPSLPREVIEELAKRARLAEALLRKQERKPPPEPIETVLVRAATLPTLTRFTFDLRQAVGVAAEGGDGFFKLTFDKPLMFDLADARASLPPGVGAIEVERGKETVTVRFALRGGPDVNSFREEGGSYIVDVAAAGSRARGAELVVPRAGKPPASAEPQKSSAQAKSPDAKPAELKPAEAKPADKKPGEAKSAEPQPASNRAVDAAPASAKPAAAARQAIAAASVDANPAAPASTMPPPQPPSDDTPAKQALAKSTAAAPRTATPSAATVPAATAPAPPSAAPVSPPAAAVPPRPSPDGAVVVTAKPQSGGVRIVFPFRAATPAAIFLRADVLWLVFDTDATIDVSRIKRDSGGAILDGVTMREPDAQVVRLRLARPFLSSAGLDGETWVVTLGDSVEERSQSLAIERTVGRHVSAAISFAEPHRVHSLRDPAAGDRIIAVTAGAPTRGLPKTQEFVEFRALLSTQGLAIEPLADDLTVEALPERVLIRRPGGLALTPAIVGANVSAGSHLSRAMVIDVQSWGFDRQSEFLTRRAALMTALSDAPEARRNPARLDVARFYLARDMYPEAKGPLDVVIETERDPTDLARALVLRAISFLMMRQPEKALKDLENPLVGTQHEAQLWRALALSRMGRFADAREGLRNASAASSSLPLELQRFAIEESVRCAIELGDFDGALRQLNDFDAIGAPPERKAQIALLSGRIAEGLGKVNDAVGAYAVAVESRDEPAAAEGHLRTIRLQQETKQIKREKATAELEQLTIAWRGDEIELEALGLLAALYTETDRVRDAFQVMRVAIAAHPGSRLTARIQDQAAKTFEAVFMGRRDTAMSPAEALALFYDFRSLTPTGARGDEMIRRLAERLIAMDLLQQAAELLQHQIDNRLKGAARAEVASRLATVYLMNRKPELALTALRSTRMSDLPSDLRKKRLLLEARSLSEIGRSDLALEIIQDMSGREVERLRADIHWNARHWRLAAEQIEKLYGERWRDFVPLDATERSDVLRAAIGYALADDRIGLDRFRQKYAAKMAEGADRRLFEVLMAPLGARGDEFAEVARSASSIETMGTFLRELRERYPDPADKVSSAPPPRQG